MDQRKNSNADVILVFPDSWHVTSLARHMKTHECERQDLLDRFIVLEQKVSQLKLEGNQEQQKKGNKPRSNLGNYIKS